MERTVSDMINPNLSYWIYRFTYILLTFKAFV
jgi:hypothetical protein